MRHRGPRPLVLLAALALPACNTDAPNPFAPPERTQTIPADARLLFTSSAWSARALAPREAYAARADGGGVTRLTFCNTDERACDTLEATAARDRGRLVMRRAARDTNNDSRVDEADDAGLLALDLQRGLQATIVQPTVKVSGVDWSPTDELVLYSGVGAGGVEDLWGILATGRDNRTIIATSNVRERRPRFNADGNAALYERIADDGKAVLWSVSNGTVAVTQGGPAGVALGGTPYIVGADADGAFSPDGRGLVFRRLVSTARPGLGEWDLMVGRFDGSAPAPIASGAGLHRGAPDWGPEGIVFPEFDGAQWRLVLLAADGANRRVLLTLAAGQRIGSVRWLR